MADNTQQGSTPTLNEQEKIRVIAEKIMGWSMNEEKDTWYDKAGYVMAQTHVYQSSGAWNPFVRLSDAFMVQARLAELKLQFEFVEELEEILEYDMPDSCYVGYQAFAFTNAIAAQRSEAAYLVAKSMGEGVEKA